MITDARLTLLTWDHYRVASPRIYNQMRDDGTLWETIDAKVESCRSLIGDLMQQGMTDIEATDYAIESVIQEKG